MTFMGMLRRTDALIIQMIALFTLLDRDLLLARYVAVNLDAEIL